MKKFILLLLILPLTLMARPEKKWLQIPTAGHYGSVMWTGTDLGDDLCNWANAAITANTWTDLGADDDCDDVARNKTGFYNSTDVDCTDGSGSGCDGAYLRIRFSKIPKGYLHCQIIGYMYSDSGAALMGWRFTDGTNNFNGVNKGFASASNNGTPIIGGWHYYPTNQGETVIKVQGTMEATNQGWGIYTRNARLETTTISCKHYPDYSDSRYIITK